MSVLPINSVLPQIIAALETRGCGVVQAPPGAGKTTGVPLALLDAGLFDGKIILLEPRRIAARTAAARLAEMCQTKIGERVGYAMRGANTTSPATRIDVVTEGVLTRMIQSDPELSGVSCILFDEFHERSLQSDFGLALCLDIRAALRPDLAILAMSATLDAEPVARLIGDAPVITSQGRSYQVSNRYLERPWAKPGTKKPRFDLAMADLIRQAVEETTGSVLAFLPGEGDIKSVQSHLTDLPDIDIRPLFGAMPLDAQQNAIAAGSKRKLVLATSIAETSLTIEGITVVVDGGRARRSVFDRASGMSRLITERVTKAEATQRAGRAGRLSEGICYKLWTKGEESGFAPYPLPDILCADLSDLVLNMAAWGAFSPDALPFLNPPRSEDFEAAQALLQHLGALGADHRITAVGRAMLAQPLHPRLARLAIEAGGDAALLAALLDHRDPLPRTAPSDLTLRLEALKTPKQFLAERPYNISMGLIHQIKADAKRISAKGPARTLGQMAALAYPDRVALHRPGDEPRFLLSGGAGAHMDPADPLARSRLLVATDLDGDRKEARIRQAAPLTEAELRALFPDQFQTRNMCIWSKRDKRVLAQTQTVFGALVLSAQAWKDAPKEAINQALCDGIRDIGAQALPWTKAARLFQARVTWARYSGTDAPDLSDTVLMQELEDWLCPHLAGGLHLEDLQKLNLLQILQTRLSWDEKQSLEQTAPEYFVAPTGTKVLIDYATDQPRVAIRLQEMFGLATHPLVGASRTPIVLELLSPAQRPVQTTSDLPQFWHNSYADVRKDMRGRYPKHFWPEDPMHAAPTRRAKPRK